MDPIEANGLLEQAQNAWVWVLEIVRDEPLWASAGAAVLSALALYILAKLLKVALYAVLITSILIGVAVLVVGPDQARTYLDRIGVVEASEGQVR